MIQLRSQLFFQIYLALIISVFCGLCAIETLSELCCSGHHPMIVYFNLLLSVMRVREGLVGTGQCYQPVGRNTYLHPKAILSRSRNNLIYLLLTNSLYFDSVL
jgi:hypothetical protein